MDDAPVRGLPRAPDVTGRDWHTIQRDDATDYDAETETHRASFDTATRSVCEAAVGTVAVVSETPPLELPPLHSAVDVEALEGLVESSITGSVGTDVHATFTFVGYEVTVHSYGVIEARATE